MLGVYVCRDVIPLFLRHQGPVDASEGIFLWLKLFLLFEAAVGVPLVMPRAYKPYNPSVSDFIQSPLEEARPGISFAGARGFTEQDSNRVSLIFDHVQLVERDGVEGVSRPPPTAGCPSSAR